MPKPQKSHDLRLPAWGPYSKRYAGIAHIPNIKHGLRFDLAVIPGHYRRQMLVPNEKWASGHHAWEAAPDLSYYAYRYEIEWKDQVYADVSFSAISEQARLVRCHFANRTDLPQNLMLHLVGYMNFPPVQPYSDEPVQLARPALPEGGLWVDALDYEELEFARPRPTDSLTPDGMVRAEIRAHGFVNAGGTGCGFGEEAGDWVSFRFQVEQPIERAVLTFRYRLSGAAPARFRLDGAVLADVTFPPQDGEPFALLSIPAGGLSAGEHTLRLVSLGGAAIELDGFAVTRLEQVSRLSFPIHAWSHTPEILPGPHPKSLILRYADTDVEYGIAWDYPDFWIRQLLHNELDILLRYLVPNNYSEIVRGGGEGHFTNIFLRPIALGPQAETTVYGFVCAGSRPEIEAAIRGFFQASPARRAEMHETARQKALQPACLPAGETYRFSQQRMAATELMNVVYPVYTRRQYIRHNTPGKWWDCLYTWDSGFIGLAQLELDLPRALDCLSAYLTEPGDPHAAFVHHGTPVPVQIYLFREIWNRTQSRAFLEKFYPSVRQYYRFLAGRYGSSTTRRLQSNLLITWEYFFESGGWDDYPAQMWVLRDYLDEGNLQESGIQIREACAATTAHAIRSAKILKTAAQTLGLEADIALYQADIDTFSEALQRYSWDAQAGYFSYVLHDESGRPTGQLYDENGLNFNMGLDGVTPLLAGICTPEQEAILLGRLAAPARFWTPTGLSTVDQSAPYYRKDGYWNGAVWFPHQWFFWKTALDLGEGDFAYRIARTALDVWKREVEATYYCFEHFLIESGRGAGWHQFGGLSSPVVSWFHAYYHPGRLTTGFDVWVDEQRFSGDNRAFTARLHCESAPKTPAVLVTMQPGPAYSILWNGAQAAWKEIHPGCFQVQLPFDSLTGTLEVRAACP